MQSTVQISFVLNSLIFTTFYISSIIYIQFISTYSFTFFHCIFACTECVQIFVFFGTLEIASSVGTSVYHNYYTNEFISTRDPGDHDQLHVFHFTTRNALASTNSVNHVTLTELVAVNFIYSDYIRICIRII